MDIFKRCKYFMPMSIGLLIIFLPVTLHLFSEAPNHTFYKIDVFKIVFNRYFDFFVVFLIFYLLTFNTDSLHLFSEAPNHTFYKIDVFKIVFNRYFDFFVVFLIFYLLTFNTDSLLFVFDNMSLARIMAHL